MFYSIRLTKLIVNRIKQIRYSNQRNLTSLDLKSKFKTYDVSIINLAGVNRKFCTETDKVTVNFILKDGSKVTIDASIGQNVMEVAQENEIDIEGACAASLACCTCHVYVKQEYFDKLGEICDLEEDMLDQAPLLKENSRLSCQIVLNKELDNIEVQLPNVTRNFYVDGHKPSHH